MVVVIHHATGAQPVAIVSAAEADINTGTDILHEEGERLALLFRYSLPCGITDVVILRMLEVEESGGWRKPEFQAALKIVAEMYRSSVESQKRAWEERGDDVPSSI